MRSNRSKWSNGKPGFPSECSSYSPYSFYSTGDRHAKETGDNLLVSRVLTRGSICAFRPPTLHLPIPPHHRIPVSHLRHDAIRYVVHAVPFLPVPDLESTRSLIRSNACPLVDQCADNDAHRASNSPRKVCDKGSGILGHFRHAAPLCLWRSQDLDSRALREALGVRL